VICKICRARKVVKAIENALALRHGECHKFFFPANQRPRVHDAIRIPGKLYGVLQPMQVWRDVHGLVMKNHGYQVKRTAVVIWPRVTAFVYEDA